MKNVDRQWTTKSAARSRNDKRMRPPLGQTILGWGQGREWGQQRAGRAAMAAVVAAKIRKARKEEEEAKESRIPKQGGNGKGPSCTFHVNEHHVAQQK